MFGFPSAASIFSHDVFRGGGGGGGALASETLICLLVFLCKHIYLL